MINFVFYSLVNILSIISIGFGFKTNKNIFYLSLFYMCTISLYFFYLLIFYFDLSVGVLQNNSWFEVDAISLPLVFLVLLVSPLCLVYNFYTIYFNFRFYTVLILILYNLLLLSFTINDFFFFYVFFEAILIPMSLIVGIWGSRGRKLHATYLFFYYTFVSSLLILFALFFVFVDFGTLYFTKLKLNFLTNENAELILYLFFFGFISKIPCFPVHIWLPEAHVEAPTVGSVILASVLLKLGYYGLIKTLFFIGDTYVLLSVKPIIVMIFLISCIYGSCAAVCQIDLKKIVAYSSVVHMNFAMLGFMYTNYGFLGSLFLMFSHGLISSALFFAVGMLYDRFQTRNILYYGGLVQYMPIFSLFYFLFIFSNMSLPGTCNFIGEILVFFSIFNQSFTILLLLVLSVVLTSVFCLILLNRVIFFQLTGFLMYKLYDLKFYEFNIFFYLAVYIILFGLKPNLLLNICSIFVI